METAFQIKDPSGIPEWRRVYDVLQPLNVGDTITYDELSDALGRPFDSARGPFYRANTELLEHDRRGLLNVKNVGYRVITAAEHDVPAMSKHRTARRSLRKARSWIQNADRAHLTPDVAERFDRIEVSLRRQEDMTRRLDQRVTKVETALQKSRREQVEHQTETDERLSKLQDALSRHGISVD
jgi:hypothetical protein